MIKIQIPTYDHIDQIRELNRKYLITHLTDAQKQNGFIRIEYDRDELKQIIANKEIVIAINDKIIVAYYLIGCSSENSLLNYQKQVINNPLSDFRASIHEIGFGVQAIVENNYRGLGLLKKMLSALVIQLSSKYRYFFSSVSKQNYMALKAHLKTGYRIVYTDINKYYIVLEL